MFLFKHLVYFVVSRMNLLSTTSSFNQYGNRPAYEIYYNRRIESSRDIRISFREVVMAFQYTFKNTMEPRARIAIALYPTMNSSGSVMFYIPSTHSIVTRDKWKSLPNIPQDILETINSLAKQHPRSKVYEGEESDFSNDDEQSELKGAEEGITAQSTSNSPSSSSSSSSSSSQTRYTYHINVKEGISRFKHLAVEALEKVLKTIESYKTWTPIKLKYIPCKNRIIPSSAFVKEKFSPTGDLIKLKGRIVGGGHRQDRSIYTTSDTESPTPDINHVFFLIGLGSSPGYTVATGDVQSAFLNASLPKNKPIFMRLD